MIKLLSVAIVAALFLESHQRVPSPEDPDYPKGPEYPEELECWTDWFDRDNPSGSGDWENFSNLYKENPGKICRKPQRIEATTLSGLGAAAAGEVIFKNDVTSGFVCRNVDQPKWKMCSDYRVRFRCHPPFCGEGVCWTDWFDRDNPSGSGDWELLSNLRKEYPGKICENPLMKVVTTDTVTPAISTGENFFIFNPTQGFVCRNKDQKKGGCRDYKLRFGCPC
ncbi:cartilage intermediate layer protein 2-like [Trematomus bernacchii]|uniref:cartilage intermediate layer protein 2-like n=1 Tax=Trematomus bernacchii TaxID=40690 RepID=UPI00146C2E2C|nr:cartilage intermediate layer protein 2-like [Trematomus bernacchii]